MIKYILFYRPNHFISYSRETYHELIHQFSHDYFALSILFSFALLFLIILFFIKRQTSIKLLFSLTGSMYLFFAYAFHVDLVAELSPMGYLFALYFIIFSIIFLYFIISDKIIDHKLVVHQYFGLFLIGIAALLPYSDLEFRDDCVALLGVGCMFITSNIRISLIIFQLSWFLGLLVYL